MSSQILLATPIMAEGDEELSLPFDVITPRSYQIELLEQAKKENIIVFLETGCGKTHVAVMLLQHIAPAIRKPSARVAVFLCPNVCLVDQQAEVIRRYTDLKVGAYYGDNVDSWRSETWERELANIEVFVMTPAILLQNLRYCFMRMDLIELLIFDECHHASKSHPYACIMREFYHPRSGDRWYKLPRILGMTASPIDGKVDHLALNIERKLDKIERMLHAKLYTVKDTSELDVVVPRPLHELEYYESTRTIDCVTQQFADHLADLKDKCIRNLLGASMYDRDMRGDAHTNVERKMVKNIDKLYNSLHYCVTELGIRCAYEAVVLLLRKYDSICDTGEAGGVADCKELFLQNAFTTLDALLPQECKSDPCAALGGAADISHFTSKVKLLISILERYRDTEDMRCIIFVERKIATRVLASLLGSSKALSSRLRFQSLAGKGAGLNVMNRKLQQQVVDSFRDGKVNVLVSTNVAEEGLDIQSCHLVIRFDLPKTPCSYIQSRGRARCLMSTIIYLVERENNEHAELLQQFKLSEDCMKEQVRSRFESVEEVRAPESTIIETFRVESTGASISTLCSVTIPSDALVQWVEGRPTSNAADAKLACQRLYEAGALTDFLLLKPDENEHPPDPTTPIESAPPATKEKSPHHSHSTVTPDAFSGTWLPDLASVQLHAYAVTFVAIPNDQAYVNFGLFLEKDLGPEAGTMEVELQLTNRRLVNAKCTPCGTLRFEPNQLRIARLFQERVFSAVLDQIPGSKAAGEWSPSRLYLLLPLKEDPNESPAPPIDWDCVENLTTDVVYHETPPDIPGSSFVRLCDGYVPVDHVVNSVVQTVHNLCIYWAREMIPNLTAESPMVMKDARYSSYLDYYDRNHTTTLKFLNQPMLRAKPLIQVHNLLTQRTKSERPGSSYQLPLELCRIRVKGLSCGLTNGISLLPSFMHRLEGLLLAIQLRQKLPACHPAVPADLILEAITTSKCEESFSLEGLELLGDAFLEVSVSERLFLLNNRMQEGELTKLRESLICNTTLEKLGRDRGLMVYIRDIQFNPNNWPAPGRVNEEAIEADDVQVHPRNRLKRTRLAGAALQGKTIADVFEALIGAHYIHGGVEAAQAMMGWLGCEVSVDRRVREEARTRSHGQLELLPESKVASLEALLKYKFQNRGLLVEAMTHASCPQRSGGRYQRLEFLGDAVLNFLITLHFYENSAKVKRDPGLLTDLRSAAVNNECFARVAVRHNLDEYLLHNAEDLAARVGGYVKFVRDSSAEAQCHGWKGDGSPKVLSDLVESLAGAVFLDSNYNLSTVWNVFKQILRPLVTPETLRLEPIRELRELCQKEKFGELKFSNERGVQGDFLLTVTVQVKNVTISESARKHDKKSATKVAAIRALAALKARGYEHFSRRSLEQTALCGQELSDLVDVAEEECLPPASVEEPGADLENGASCPPVGTFASISSAPASSEKQTPNSELSIRGAAAQKPVSGFKETQNFASSMTLLVQEHQRNGKLCELEERQRTGAAHADIPGSIGSRPEGRAVELTSTIDESKISKLAANSHTAAHPRKSDPSSVREASPPHEADPDAAPTQTHPQQVDQSNDFEKLCHAYKASLDAWQNFASNFGRSQDLPFDVSMNQTTSRTATTASVPTTGLMAQCNGMMSRLKLAPTVEIPVSSVQPSARTCDASMSHTNSTAATSTTTAAAATTTTTTCFTNQHKGFSSTSEVAPTLEIPATPSVKPSSATSQLNGVLNWDRRPIAERIHAATDHSVELLNRGPSGTIASVLSSSGTDGNRKESSDPLCAGSDASPVEVSRADQLDASRAAVMSAAVPLNAPRPHQQVTDAIRHFPGQAQPQPAPGPEVRWQKGEARSLLNVICMTHRWQDPKYSSAWRGGVSHAPLFVYRVQTTITSGGQSVEIDVEGEVEKDVKGAKDSAAARLLAWFQERGIPLGR